MIKSSIKSARSARCKKNPPAWHAAFEEMIPVIERHARVSFLHLNPEAREEAIQEVICNACQAYARLVEIGKTELAYASVLASFGVSQTREGRKVGNSLNVRDISSDYCRQRKNLILERLDHYDSEENAWNEILVEDKHAGPAQTAAVRIDFAAWLKTLKPRTRKIARFLSLGHKTKDTAKKFGMSEGRVSQLRLELKTAWELFTGSANVACAQ